MLVAAAMAWLSRLAFKLDTEGKAALRQAAFEENIRLALYRMDLALSGLISMENARPYESYPALIHATPNSASFYFQFDPKGRLILPAAVKQQNDRWNELRRKVTQSALLISIQYTTNIQTIQKVMPPAAAITPPVSRIEPQASTSSLAAQMQRLSDSILASNAAPPNYSRSNAIVQNQLNLNEANARESIVSERMQFNSQNAGQSQTVKPQSPVLAPVAPPQNTPPAQAAVPREFIRTTKQDTNLEMMNPIWMDNDLFLVRRAYIGKQEYIQGCWVDWPSIRTMLLKRVEDLLPHADLAPLLQAPAAGQTRLLASIPAMLLPGPVPEEPHEGWSILHVSLSIAWTGVLLATFAVAIVLRRTMELNQRRGAFVSAVTHELRTPLTTFRLYTEMLDAGMVTEDAKRKQYYSTLHSESERLSHLVENVLMYAQLENSHGGAERIETVRLADLKERMAPSLSERAMQCGMKLTIEIDQPACNAAVRADISAVERILFNLVDNAGKYGRADQDPGILLSIALNGGIAALSVCDRGPGIAPRLRKKLFMPFSKSASEAANSAPGVGLGLSISRGLARQMHGDLHYDFGFSCGARFVLTLPLA
jgi:signal transduction histidine kinase